MIWSNYRPAVDAAIAVCLNAEHCRSGATEAGRWATQRAMKYLCSIFAVALIAVKGFCGEGLPLAVHGQWAILTNIGNFRELHSTTNLAPEIRSYVLGVLGSMGVEAKGKRVVEPEEPLMAGCRLIWGATDGTNYVMHYEFLYSPFPGKYWTNHCIAAAIYDPKDGKLKCCNGGYLRRFKNYEDFIIYDQNPTCPR